MDEPCSALDPIATAQVEELIGRIAPVNYTVVIVTHSMQQPPVSARKPRSFTWAIWSNIGDTEQIFTNPKDERTERYVTGRIG